MTAGVSPVHGAGLRIASVPARDGYVDVVLPQGSRRIGPRKGASPWLDVGHLAAHAGDIDVLHLHLGHDRAAWSHLEGWAETVRRLGVPLVVTVHRLPSGGSAAAADVAAVLGTAEVVLTLTPAAADEIADRYRRTAIVVAHPSVAVPRPDVNTERGLVGLVLGAGLAGQRSAQVRAARCGAVSGGGRLRLLLDGTVPAAEVSALAAGKDVEVVGAARDGDGWVGELQELHVAVIGEGCRSHSRDLEICRDVGTRVVAPACGWFADQWSDVVTYGLDDEDRLDGMSLTAAVAAALTGPVPRPMPRAWREEQRAAVQGVHARVYEQVAADRRPC